MFNFPAPFVHFKSYTPELLYPEEKMQSFFESVKELDPFIDHYSFRNRNCAKKGLHFAVVFVFKQPLEGFNISEKTRQVWNLTTEMDDVFKRKPYELWWKPPIPIQVMGIPPIKRAVPTYILKDLVGDDLSDYCLDDNPDCFRNDPLYAEIFKSI